MVEEFGWVKDVAANAGSAAGDILLYVVIFIIIGAAVAFILWYLSFKHEVVIRYITKTRKFVIKDKARITMEDGVPCWKLFKMRTTVRPPGPEAIEITKKGRFFAECYWSEDNPSPVWLEDKGNPADAFTEHAYTSDERSYAVAQHLKAYGRRKGGLWEKIMQIALPVMMIIIVAIPFVFWGELTNTSVAVQTAQAETTMQLAKVSEQNARLLSIMAGKLEAGELVIEQNIPPDAKVPE